MTREVGRLTIDHDLSLSSFKSNPPVSFPVLQQITCSSPTSLAKVISKQIPHTFLTTSLPHLFALSHPQLQQALPGTLKVTTQRKQVVSSQYLIPQSHPHLCARPPAMTPSPPLFPSPENDIDLFQPSFSLIFLSQTPCPADIPWDPARKTFQRSKQANRQIDKLQIIPLPGFYYIQCPSPILKLQQVSCYGLSSLSVLISQEQSFQGTQQIPVDHLAFFLPVDPPTEILDHFIS